MAKVNSPRTDQRVSSERLAGGYGALSARSTDEQEFRRLVLACLLWEDIAYENGESVARKIAYLVPRLEPSFVASVALEARKNQKLRHIPLFIAREMARDPRHRKLLGELLPKIVTRADGITDFLALYWRAGKSPIAKQVKLGLRRAFENFDEYQLLKYQSSGKAVSLSDAIKMVRPKPFDGNRSRLYKSIIEGNASPPDTWEVALSSGKDKKETWERLVSQNKLGVLAFLRNIRNMKDAGVSPIVISQGIRGLSPTMALPHNFLMARQINPEFSSEIEELMLRCFAQSEKLSGKTLLVVDVSGSMGTDLSSRSNQRRIDVAGALAMLAAEVCEDYAIYVTAGSGATRQHSTRKLERLRGFELCDRTIDSMSRMGYGGIFTRQCIDYLKEAETDPVDRIIVFSDSQDMERGGNVVPSPFGAHNYIVDVSSHGKGVNYEGVWSAEISGWSEHFLDFIREYERCSE